MEPLALSFRIYIPPGPKLVYSLGAVSTKPWEPIFNVRRRPAWVQTTVFDLLRQLKVLRTVTATLPSIDTISLPSHRQVGVSFGDMGALCDSIEFILDNFGVLGVGYGGPDDRGTLWIKFYKTLAEDRTSDNQLQFVIWINSVNIPTVALEEGLKTVYDQMRNPIRPIETKISKFQRREMFAQMRGLQAEAVGEWGAERTMRGYSTSKTESRASTELPIDQSTDISGREFPDADVSVDSPD